MAHKKKSLSPDDGGIDRQKYAATFLESGEEYERFRPGFPVGALELFVRERVGTALDLGAGTGKLTRLLMDRADEVIAVDPSEQMLAQLRRVSPMVDARNGTAESIPVQDASVDLVTVAQAFHWFDRERACVELRRVLRPDGLLALLWNTPDADCAWDIACGRIAHPERDGWMPDQSVAPQPPELPGFAPLESAWIRWTEELSRSDYLARWGTVSAMLLAAEDDRHHRFLRMGAVLDGDPETAGLEILLLRQATEVVVYRTDA